MGTERQTAPTTDRLQVDFLFLDLEKCSRCRGTDRSLESAFEIVRGLLAEAGIAVAVNKIRVESAEQARELRFVSSPTIRVNERDIALELRESPCGSDPCTDGCGASIGCRVWVYRGREHTEAPVPMIVDAILREVYGGAIVSPEATRYELPENLDRFFAAKTAAAGAEAGAGATCCSPAEQQTCCDSDAKAECCAAASGASCGCR